jgi:uncharacterized membrane protein YkvA (DUF1232 family)
VLAASYLCRHVVGVGTDKWPDHGRVRNWLIGLGIGVVCVVVSWAVLVLIARRLPPGIPRDLAALIPDCVTAIRRLRNDPRVPRRAKIVIVFAGLWVASPIDLIPEFLPVIGPLDDIVVVALALRYAGRRVPRRVLLTAWPGEPRLLVRLLGRDHDDVPVDRATRRARHGGPPSQGAGGTLRRVSSRRFHRARACSPK